ncbi:hypothetical protein [uncultured Deefgea sp.]|uniref:hypothetical protein n=1 Tax=uncultured Deefgea sp. TaxID=1304914 RepID=UPI00259661C7|nr:hypothetical protein [uncultured Deefgea sp.]
MDKYDFALESFKNVQELIKFVDQKSGAVLVVSGLVLTAYLEFSKILYLNFSNVSFFGVVTFILGLVSVFLLMLILHISIFKVLRPRLASAYAGDKLSLLYFNHLSLSKDKEELFCRFNSLSEDVVLINFTDQIFEVSKILELKILYLNKSMSFLFFSVVSVVFFVFSSRLI